MTDELERVRQERVLILSGMHTKPQPNTGAWWRGACDPDCPACQFAEMDADFELLVRKEVQRQTVEATASWLVALGEYLLAAKLREEMLSPAQEVRNGRHES